MSQVSRTTLVVSIYRYVIALSSVLIVGACTTNQQHGTRTSPDENGYVTIRRVYIDSTIQGDSVRIEGTMYNGYSNDTLNLAHFLVIENSDRIGIPKAYASSARYSYVVKSGTMAVSFGPLGSSIKCLYCVKIERLFLPPKTVIVIDSYIKGPRI